MSVPTRSGFIGLAGRPNVGKSTLANALVGSKVAIVSDRPQTTRRAVRGVATAPDRSWQMVLVDLPGVQRPRDTLTSRMQKRVERELRDSDAILFVLNGEQGIGPGDLFIASMLEAARPEAPVICAVNKIDRLKRHELLEALAAAGELEIVDEVFPISARRGTGLEQLHERLTELMPEGAADVPGWRELRSAERGPSGGADPRADPAPDPGRDPACGRGRGRLDRGAGGRDHRGPGRRLGRSQSQKAILIGKGGRMVREVGTAARRELEQELGTQVFLDLKVRLREHWRRDESLLDRLGID